MTLSERETATPGPLRFNRTPYLIEVVNSIADQSCESITLCWAAQCAKTVGLFVMMAYGIAVDPGQILCVYPNGDLAKSTSRNRIQPLIEDCRTLARHKPSDKDKFTLLEMYLSRCTLRLTGANSPANLASRPIRYLYADEIDKFPAATDKEAGALDLAVERTKTFWNRKIVCTSTPTLDTGNIWRRFLEGDQRYFFVPCPHCSKKAGASAGFQKLSFENLKFDSSLKHDDGSYDLEAIRETVFYECQYCKGKILDKHKRKLLRLGEWRASANGNRHRSYHLSALYPSWIRFSDVAVKFLESKDFPDSLRNFRNSWLGLPWLRELQAADEEEVFAHRSDYKLRTCPVEPIAVVLTADVQAESLWYVVRSWLPGETSYLLDYGQLPNTDALLNVVGSIYDGPNGEPIRITHALIDSGFNTKEVYNFCRQHRFIPVKGRSGSQQTTPVKWYPVKEEGLQLMMIAVDTFKQALQDKLGKPLGSPGAWYLPEDVCGIYASHITSEVLTKKKDSKGFDVYAWEKIREANHMLDCYSEDTEVLTANGWRYFKHLEQSDILATVNLETDAIEYQKPVALIRREYGGDMVEIDTKSYNLLVTPNHRMVTYSSNKGKPSITKASELNEWHRLKVKASGWVGDSSPVTLPSPNRYMPEVTIERGLLCEFLGWYLSEGSCSLTRKGKSIRRTVTIYQNEGESQEILRAMLDRLPWKYHEFRRSKEGPVAGFTIANQQAYELVWKLGDVYTKYVPQLVKDSSRDCILAFLFAATQGDRWIARRSTAYGTVSKQLADDIQELWIKAGQNASVTRKEAKPYCIRGKSGTNTVPQYQVTQKKSKMAYLRDGKGNKAFRTVQYDGNVYCATVPNGTLVVRRNGKVLICGNCEVYQLAIAADLRLRQQRPKPSDEESKKPKPKASTSSVEPFARRDGRSFFDFGRN